MKTRRDSYCWRYCWQRFWRLRRRPGAFRNFDTDWQLWVEVGEKPIPRKLVITSKTLNSAPQYTLRVKSWKTGVEPAPDAFPDCPAVS